MLIYQDELIPDNRTSLDAPAINGTLICRSGNQARVGWHLPRGILVNVNPNGDFMQRRTSPGVIPSVSKLSVNRNNIRRIDDITNGLWTCRLNSNSTVAVGI